MARRKRAQRQQPTSLKLKLKQQPTEHGQQNEPRVNPRQSHFSRLSYDQYDWLNEEEEEYPTRSPHLARELMELINGCPEAAIALEVICSYALSSGTGDELGFSIDVDETSSQPKTVAIAQEVLARCFTLFDYWQIIWRMVAWGDTFGLLDVDTRAKMIVGVKLLPTWQVHRLEDEQANLLGFNQRWGARDTEMAFIPGSSMVQWSYNKRRMYGRSLYHEARRDWQKLKDGDEDLAVGSRSSAIQPNLHIMPPGVGPDYKRAYKEDHEARRKKGLIPDFYLDSGQQMIKPPGIPGAFPLAGLIDNFNLRRLRIAARSRVPLYLLGIDQKFASEIAMQPAISFVVFVGVIRQLFAQGLRQIINTELALQGVAAPWRYKIVFPKINVNPWMTLLDEDADKAGIEDVDG